MIDLERPLLLLLALPWLAGWVLFARLQMRALRAVEARVGERFRAHFSRHTRRSLGWHLALLAALGLLGVVAAAGPGLPGRGEMVSGGRILLLLDASSSMFAQDVAPLFPEEDSTTYRFEQARRIGLELVRRLEGREFALATFSGSAAVNLPMSRDPAVLEEALRTVEIHGYYRNTGSSFAEALDLAFHFVRPEDPDLQVVLISDGEMPFPQSFAAPLEVLAANGVPVHAVTVGSERGQKRQIFDFKDVVAGRKPPGVIRSFTTRRVDEHLAEMAERTGGRFAVARRGVIEEIEPAIRQGSGRARRAARDELRTDLSALPLALFLVGFLAEALLPWPRRRAESFDFDPRRIGEAGEPRSATVAAPRPRAAAVLAVALLLVAAAACDRGAERQAHRDNERGIALDRLGRHRAARRHYERAIAAAKRPQIPTYNLARSLTLAGDFSEAHEIFQEALRLDPDLRPAYFNDGVALYRWGAAERDPENCELERTLELWEGALGRFSDVAARDVESTELGAAARADRDFLEAEIAAVRRLIAEPPPECRSRSESSAGGGGGGQGGGEPNEGESGGQGGDGEPAAPDGSGGPQGAGGGPGEEGEGGSGEEGEAEGEAGGSGGLTPEELEQIESALQRIAAQAIESGKYHRRTLPEQFRKEDWSSPDAILWW